MKNIIVLCSLFSSLLCANLTAVTVAGVDDISETSFVSSDAFDDDVLHTTANVDVCLGTTVYSGGNGSFKKPYLISTYNDLITMSTQHQVKWHYLQTQDISFPADHLLVDWNGDGSIDSDDESGFLSIGGDNGFDGTYDGAGYSIANLYINRPTPSQGQYIGLFNRCVDAGISNLTLIDATVTGYQFVGALVGNAQNSSIDNCAVYADVLGYQFVGGVAGRIEFGQNSKLTQTACYVDVEGYQYVGGLAGRVLGCYGSVGVKDCYTSGSVDGTQFVGGFIGSNNSCEITNVYSNVNSLPSDAGGLMSLSAWCHSYVHSSYFDKELAGLGFSEGGIACSSSEMKDVDTYVGWDFTDGGIWSIDPDINDGYPYLNGVGCVNTANETVFEGVGDWFDEDLWSNGVPDISKEVTAIISGTCNIDSGVVVQNVVVSPGSVLNIPIGVALDVVEEVVLETDSILGVGELYFDDPSVVDSVCQEKFFKPGQWTFVCCPYSLPAKDLFPHLQMATSWSAPGAEYWVVKYDQFARSSGTTGMSPIYDEDEVLQMASGYMIWVDTSQVAVFKYENVNSSGSVGVDCTLGQTVLDAGWNLVGNPYTFTMEYADIFDCSMNHANFTNEIHLWDGHNLRYATWQDLLGDPLAETVDPLEAFFIKSVITGDGRFCMTRGECACPIPEGTTMMKSAQVESELSALTIVAEAGGFNDMTFLRVDGNATGQMDQGLDAIKMGKDVSNAPAIFTYDADGVECSINAFSMQEGDCIVEMPVILPPGTDSLSLKFSVVGSDNYQYFLFDTKHADMVLLTDDLIIDIDDVDEVGSRFMILVKNTVVDDVVTSVDDAIQAEEFPLRCTGLEERVKMEVLTDHMVGFWIYDNAGRLVHSGEMNGLSRDFFYLATGVYIVRMESDAVMFAKSVIVK